MSQDVSRSPEKKHGEAKKEEARKDRRRGWTEVSACHLEDIR
jgi:hypothetical protein